MSMRITQFKDMLKGQQSLYDCFDTFDCNTRYLYETESTKNVSAAYRKSGPGATS